MSEISITEPTWCNFHSVYLKIKGLYRFRALLAHPQEALHKRHLVYYVRMSAGCATVVVKLQSWHSQLTLYARNIPSAVCAVPPEDEQVMLETCRGPWFSINWMKIASCWFRYTDILWCTVSKTLRLSEMSCFHDLEKTGIFVALNRIVRDKGREFFKIRKTWNSPDKAKTNGIHTCRPSERNPQIGRHLNQRINLTF
jgi:hypothetical protein